MSEVLLVCADARRIPLPDNSVQCVVTSPPYFGLRKYDGEQDLIWHANDTPCGTIAHDWAEESQTVEMRRGKGLEKLGERYRGGGKKQGELSSPYTINRGECRLCGAWKGGYGLEPTIEMYVAHTIEILREIRRVLRPDGVVFWNIGDSYANDGKWGGETGGKQAYLPDDDRKRTGRQKRTTGLKPKDLCLIPERVALAAQTDGWWVRSRVIWHKANPMPEPVRGRPTSAHEHIWVFTKSADYFWDADAVRTTRNLPDVWHFATQPYPGAHFATFPEELPRTAILAATSPRGACSSCGAPWARILKPTAEYAEHLGERQNGYDYEGYEVTGNRIFNKVDAAYETIGWRPTCGCGGCLPDDLEIINSPNGANSAEDDWKVTGRQGMNRPRVEGEGTRPITRYEQRGYAAQIRKSPHRRVMESVAGKEAFEHYIRTDKAGARAVPPELLECWIERNWLTRVTPPDFEKWPATRPCIVLDPFGGSGTTGRVASELNRSAILLDLAYTHDYGALARERTSRVQREMFA